VGFPVATVKYGAVMESIRERESSQARTLGLFDGQVCMASAVGAEVRQQPARTDAGEAGVRLESKDNNWKFEVSTAKVVKHRCGCRTCCVCGKRRGWETRQILLDPEKLALFPAPYLLTLTVDPKNFDSPEAAYDFVRKGGYIRRLLRLLGIDVWVWVLEFQKNGSSHWHILMDLSSRGRLTRDDLRWCWRTWRGKWKIGGLDLQEQKPFVSARHAVMYITKYLTKPVNEYPGWFLKGKHQRMCQASKRIGRLTRGPARPESKEEAEVRHRRQSKPMAERMAECGMSCKLLQQEVCSETGEERTVYLGEVQANRDDLVLMSKRGELPRHIRLVELEVECLGETFHEVLLENPQVGLAWRLDVLRRHLRESGYEQGRMRAIQERCEKFLGASLANQRDAL